MMVTVTLLAFLWESPITGGILTLTIATTCFLVGVRLTYLLTILKFMLPFYLFLLLSMALFNVAQLQALTGKEELTTFLTIPANWWILGGAKLSVEGILYGLNVIFKTLTMILIIPLGVFTTDINQMVVSLVRTKIPYKIVFIFSSTLRLFPLLVEELQAIIDAQRLRGLAIEKMNLIKRAQVYAKIAVPLILNAMTKSQKLEVVLQSKAFSGSANRTFLYESTLTPQDYWLIALFIALLILGIVLYFLAGVGKFPWLLY
jgi:energy-coupling factor transport system permease protein